MTRRADAADLPGIVSLWTEAFGDGEKDVLDFFAAFSCCRSYVTESGGQIAAMVHALPQTLSPAVPAAYLYAVATRRAFRGRGLCRALMAFAERDLREQGTCCCALSPAEPGLFDYYGTMGYETAFFRRHTAFPGGREITPEDYLLRREALLTGPHMVCDSQTLDYAARCYGLRFYETETGIAAAGERYTAEVLPQDVRGGEANGMIKWLTPGVQIETGYLGFALE